MKWPLYPLSFALYPVLALLVVNVREVDPRVALRPLLIAVTAAVLVLIILLVVLRNWHKAALLTTGLLILFFSYGHLYGVITNAEVFGLVIGRHRYLVPVLVAFYAVFASWVIRRGAGLEGVTRILNLSAVVLLILPLVQLGSYAVQAQSTKARIQAAGTGDFALSKPKSGELPDIYYIVLDTYTRADALERDFGFDNRPFIDELQKLGFYVAECSRTNYSGTKNALSAALNMRYLSKQDQQLLDSGDPSILLRESLVRRALEDIGYKTVAFETGYEWSRLKDADIYLSLTGDPLTLQRLSPFESILVDSTALSAIAALEVQSFSARAGAIDDVISEVENPHAGYIENQLFILEQLPQIATVRDPTFAFVHLLIPHVPYVFDAGGKPWLDPGFYSGERAEPIDEEHWRIGYTSEIQFINRRMLEILDEILARSKVDPIIVMHGDHGLRGENRLQILNAYFLGQAGGLAPYPSISPVNSFRLIFNRYFGTDLGFINDMSYYANESDPRPETSELCQDISGSTE